MAVAFNDDSSDYYQLNKSVGTSVIWFTSTLNLENDSQFQTLDGEEIQIADYNGGKLIRHIGHSIFTSIHCSRQSL